MYTGLLKRLLIPLKIFSQFPLRLYRLFLHFTGAGHRRKKIGVNSAADWWTDLPFYVLDIIGFSELLQTLILLTLPKCRPLNASEEIIARAFYGELLDTRMLWINDGAHLIPKKTALAYVTFNTIHYSSYLEEEIFIHELMHTVQYQRFGSVYLGRALRAQWSKDTYAYGGAAGLARARASGKILTEFNFEQQAQIMEDFYRLRNDDASDKNAAPLTDYVYFYEQMFEIY